MEDTLGDLVFYCKREILFVLILVLMEDTLGDLVFYCKREILFKS